MFRNFILKSASISYVSPASSSRPLTAKICAFSVRSSRPLTGLFIPIRKRKNFFYFLPLFYPLFTPFLLVFYPFFTTALPQFAPVRFFGGFFLLNLRFLFAIFFCGFFSERKIFTFYDACFLINNK